MTAVHCFSTFKQVFLRAALFWAVMQRELLVVYRRFDTAYRFRLKGTNSPETSLRNYQHTLYNNPEE